MGAYLDILLYNVVAFLGVLTVIVAVHEAGHFFVARWCRVRVLTFSIGIGPEQFGWTGREGTRYKVSLLPLGGYVRMAGGLMPGTEEAAELLQEFALRELLVAIHVPRLYQLQTPCTHIQGEVYTSQVEAVVSGIQRAK